MNKQSSGMNGQFKGLSLSHHTAPVEIRELFSLDENASKRLLSQFREILGLSEALILSTCNRTEIYYAAEPDLTAEIIKLTGTVKGILNTAQYLSHFQTLKSSDEAVNHLFEVAMGLDSQVVGDIQISNQVKNAYQWSADMNLAGPFLHRLLHTIFFTHKRISQETGFRDGAASVSYAAVELVELLAEGLKNPRILVAGLGDTGSDVVRNLFARKVQNVVLANRTFGRTAVLMLDCGYEGIDFQDVAEEIRHADIIISTVAKADFIKQDFLKNLPLFSHKYFIDLSVPRSIEASAEEIPGVVLYNIDEIKAKADAGLQKRLAAVPHVKAIIAEAIAGLADWSQEMLVSPTIQKMKNALEQLRQEEMKRYLKNLSPKEAEAVEKVTQSLVQKILKMHVLPLKAACQRGEAETLVDLLNELFDLEKAPSGSP
jgi:glutamyl-tRNA reductase